MRAFKAERGCERCGEADPRCLELHHRDPTTKHKALQKRKRGVEQKSGRNGWTEVPLRDIEAELAKCDVLCANCHRKLYPRQQF